MQPIRTAHNEYKSYSNDMMYRYTETTTVSDVRRRFRVHQCSTFVAWNLDDLSDRKNWVGRGYKNGDFECDPFKECQSTNKRHDDLSRNKLFMFTSAVLLTFFIATVHNLGEVI